MAGRIICAFSCLLCAFPFFMAGYLGKMSRDPMYFWSGSEKQVKALVKNVPEYNREMIRLYRRFGLAFLTAALLSAVYPMAGVALIFINCTLGLWLMWRGYKAALKKYS